MTIKQVVVTQTVNGIINGEVGDIESCITNARSLGANNEGIKTILKKAISELKKVTEKDITEKDIKEKLTRCESYLEELEAEEVPPPAAEVPPPAAAEVPPPAPAEVPPPAPAAEEVPPPAAAPAAPALLTKEQVKIIYIYRDSVERGDEPNKAWNIAMEKFSKEEDKRVFLKVILQEIQIKLSTPPTLDEVNEFIRPYLEGKATVNLISEEDIEKLYLKNYYNSIPTIETIHLYMLHREELLALISKQLDSNHPYQKLITKLKGEINCAMIHMQFLESRESFFRKTSYGKQFDKKEIIRESDFNLLEAVSKYKELKHGKEKTRKDTTYTLLAGYFDNYDPGTKSENLGKLYHHIMLKKKVQHSPKELNNIDAILKLIREQLIGNNVAYKAFIKDVLKFDLNIDPFLDDDISFNLDLVERALIYKDYSFKKADKTTASIITFLENYNVEQLRNQSLTELQKHIYDKKIRKMAEYLNWGKLMNKKKKKIVAKIRNLENFAKFIEDRKKKEEILNQFSFEEKEASEELVDSNPRPNISK